MPNLRACIVAPTPFPPALPSGNSSGAAAGQVGVYLWASDGREVLVTRAQLRQQFLAATGGRAQRRAAAAGWLKQQAVAALGAEQLDAAAMAFDFDDSDGTPTQLEVTG